MNDKSRLWLVTFAGSKVEGYSRNVECFSYLTVGRTKEDAISTLPGDIRKLYDCYTITTHLVSSSTISFITANFDTLASNAEMSEEAGISVLLNHLLD